MTKVLFLPEVVDQFLELAEILYNKGTSDLILFRSVQTDFAVLDGFRSIM